LAACCLSCVLHAVKRWNRLFPKAKMTEEQQADLIKPLLTQHGKIANLRERLASVIEFRVGRCTR
jgi:hypothetical protein